MPQYNFELRGWHAIVAVVLLLACAAVSTIAHTRSVDDGMREALRQYLLNEYSGRGPADIQRILSEAQNGQNIESSPEVAKRDVEFSSISAVGKVLGEFETVRVTITVDGGPPPRGAALRYFRVERALSGQWLVVGQTDSYRYYSELFPFL